MDNMNQDERGKCGGRRRDGCLVGHFGSAFVKMEICGLLMKTNACCLHGSSSTGHFQPYFHPIFGDLACVPIRAMQ